MKSTLEGLLSCLVEHPEEAASTWLVIADWLEEHNDPRCEVVRLRHDPGYRPDLEPAGREGRVQALLAGGLEPCVPRLANPLGMQFVWVPPGTFLMGSPAEEAERLDDEGPQHELEISRGFWLGAYPVTQEEYRAVTKADPSHFREGGGGKKQVKGLDTRRFPVETVSWDDAVRFCDGLNAIGAEKGENCSYRLPTEAEWEYACRGGALLYQVFHHGDRLSSEQANFNGDYPYGGADKGPYLQRPVAVDDPRYRPNAWGLWQMHGNVWEWCSDWYGPYPSGRVTDPQGPAEGSGRVVRGGSWCIGAGGCRSAVRDWGAPDDRSCYLGFRVARVPSG